ncbi:MAG: hypothetical protein AB7V07_05585, partial [Candidatus Delongbacteria bacterium]
MTLYPAFILVLSFILAVYSGQYADIFYSFLRITAFFILPVLAFSAYLFRPVLSYLKKEKEYDTLVGDRVRDLTLLTVSLFFLTALFYSLINLLFMKFSYESVFSFGTVVRVINRNCVMGTIFTYFLADSFSIYLK